MANLNKSNKLVYSTQSGDERQKTAASSGLPRSLPPAQQDLKIMRDKKGRRGKMVTVISGFRLTETDLTTLAKTLKALCGAGGTVKHEDGLQIIEIQGDHREKIAEKLKGLGYKVKLAGG
ncbi:MAG: stress response translation initiation inhibitor YciH [Chloroflexi bacterium]|nr:stress response translation initiation inhibitor YciH [Chloroflexota bacterium]